MNEETEDTGSGKMSGSGNDGPDLRREEAGDGPLHRVKLVTADYRISEHGMAQSRNPEDIMAWVESELDERLGKEVVKFAERTEGDEDELGSVSRHIQKSVYVIDDFAAFKRELIQMMKGLLGYEKEED